MRSFICPFLLFVTAAQAGIIDYKSTCVIGATTVIVQAGNCRFAQGANSIQMSGTSTGVSFGPAGFSTEIRFAGIAQASITPPSQTIDFTFVFSYLGSIYTDGPIRPGVAVLQASGIGGGNAFVSSANLEVGGFKALCPGIELNCSFAANIPITLGMPFQLSLRYFANGVAGGFASRQGGGSLDFHAVFQLYELNPNGSLGATVSMRELPDPSTLLLGVLPLLALWGFRPTALVRR